MIIKCTSGDDDEINDSVLSVLSIQVHTVEPFVEFMFNNFFFVAKFEFIFNN